MGDKPLPLSAGRENLTPGTEGAPSADLIASWENEGGSIVMADDHGVLPEGVIPHTIPAGTMVGTIGTSESEGTNPKDLLGVKKPPLHLVPPAALINLSMVMGLGAKKYGEYNWRRKKVRLSVYVAAAMRHLLALYDGEDLDDESKMFHSTHTMACVAIIDDARATGNLVDDRPPAGAAARLMEELTKR